MNTFVVGTDSPGVATAVRILSPDGTVYRKSTAMGGTDPAGFVAFDAGESAAGKYDVATTEIGDGEFLFTMPADVDAGAFQFRAIQAGNLVSTYTAGDVGYWDGVSFQLGFSADDRETLGIILNQALLIGAVPASVPATTGAIFDPTGAETSVYWSQAFLGVGQIIDGWTSLTFTLKDNRESDDDSDALLTVRISNPAAATDGVLIFNRQPVAPADPLRTKGILTVEGTNPNAIVRATLLPDALNLPPSPDNVSYSYEWDWWDGADVKRQIGRGDFTLTRSVRRGVVAP